MDTKWEVHSYHLNIDAGDSAIHVLVETRPVEPKEIPHKIVLVDAGFESYGEFWVDYHRRYLNQRYHGEATGLINFDAIVITHWDSDHVGGVLGLFSNDIQTQWNAIPDSGSDKGNKAVEWKSFFEDYRPTFCAADTHIYVPYWTTANTKTTLNLDKALPTPPRRWSLDDASNLLLNEKNPYNKKQIVTSKAIAKVHWTPDTLLGYDFFRGEKAILNSHHAHWTDPEKVSKALPLGPPAMFCVMADTMICGNYTLPELEQWEWNDELNSPKLQLNTNANQHTATLNSTITHLASRAKNGKQEESNKSLMGQTESQHDEAVLTDPDQPNISIIPKVSTTPVNQSSIACLIIWPDPNKAILSHYFAGDLGEDIEQMVLKWSTVPSTENQHIRNATRCSAAKLSHHGARQSTPLELLSAFDPSFLVVSNGVRSDWNHPKPEILLLIDAWKANKVGGMDLEIDFDFRATNFPPYLTLDANGDFAIDPGRAKYLRDATFRGLLDRLWKKDTNKTPNTFTDTEFSLENSDDEMKTAFVRYLLGRWGQFSGYTKEKYAGMAVACSSFYEVSSLQKLRSVLIRQRMDGSLTTEDITQAEAGDLSMSHVPNAVKAVRKVDRSRRERIRPKSTRERKKPVPQYDGPYGLSKLQKKIMQKTLKSRNRVRDDDDNDNLLLHHATIVRPKVTLQLTGDLDHTASAGSLPVSRLGDLPKFCFIAPGIYNPITEAVTTDAGDDDFSHFLECLKVHMLALDHKPSPSSSNQTDRCVVHRSDELAEWLEALFGDSDVWPLIAQATATTVESMEFETSLWATMTPKAKQHVPKDSPLRSSLSFQTRSAGIALELQQPQNLMHGGSSKVTRLCTGNMLVFGLGSSSKQVIFTLDEIFGFLECGSAIPSILAAVSTKFVIDLNLKSASRNAIWFLPDPAYSTTLRLQFAYMPEEQDSTDWMNGLLGDISGFAKDNIIIKAPIKLITKKSWGWQRGGGEDSFTIESNWEVTLRVDVTLKNSRGKTLDLQTAVVVNQAQTRWLLIFPPPSTELGIYTDMGFLCEFFTDLLPFPVPSLADYLPLASSLFIRKIVVSPKKGGKSSFEIVFELVLASTSFITTLILGPQPQFTGKLFMGPDLGNFTNMHLFPFYEEHLQCVPTIVPGLENNGTLDIGKLHKIMTKSDLPRAPFGMVMLDLEFSLNQSAISFRGIIADDSDPTPSTGTFPQLQLDVAMLYFEYNFAKKSVDISAGLNFYLVPRKAAHQLKAMKMGLLIEYSGGNWLLSGSIAGLSFAHIYQMFDTDVNDEVMNLLENIKIINLDLTYQYDKSGLGKSLSIDGSLALGSLELDFSYVNRGSGEWDLSAELNSGSKARNGSLVDIVKEFCGPAISDQLPDCVTKIPLQSEQNPSGTVGKDAAVSLRLHKDGDYLVVVCALDLASGLAVRFLHLQSKRKPVKDSVDPSKVQPPKRILLLGVSRIEATSSAPFVSSVVQPFDELIFAWVQGGSDNGFTKPEIEYLNKYLGEKHKIRYNNTSKQGSTGSSKSPLALASGCHFMVVSQDRVILDHVFQQKKDKETRSDTVDLATTSSQSKGSPSSAPLKKEIGPLSISAISVDFSSNTLRIILTASAKLGTFGVSLIGLTINVDMTNANLLDLRKANITLGLSGMALELNAPPLSIAGILVNKSTPDKTDYFGGAQVGFKPYSLIGLGRYSKAKQSDLTSFFAYVQLNGPLAQLGCVQITGVKIGLGYNTGIKSPKITKISSFPFCALTQTKSEGVTLFSTDPLAFLESFLGDWFFDSPGTNWIAMGMELVICEAVDLSAAVIVTITPKLLFNLYAQGALQMPPLVPQERSFLNVQFGIICSIDFKAGSAIVESRLGPASFILHHSCHLSGGFAMCSWWDPSPLAGDWVCTIGGYHPQYSPSPHYPVPPRLSISWQVSDAVSITGCAYFAITPDVLMAGGKLEAQYRTRYISASFSAWADFLVNYAPFYFKADLGIIIGGSFTAGIGRLSFTISAHTSAMLHLEGPPLHGVAEINVCSHNFIVAFGDDGGKKGPPVVGFRDVCEMLLEQSKSKDSGTYHVLSIETGELVTQPESTESSAKTPWTVRGANFAFRVQALFPVTWGAVNHQDFLQASDNNQPPSNVIEQAIPLYIKPMKHNGDQKTSSKLHITVRRSDKQPISGAFSVEPVYGKVARSIWGEYSEAKDPLRSGNSISELLRPPPDGAGLRMMTGMIIRGAEPIKSTDTMGPFNIAKISDHTLFDDPAKQPVLPSQPFQRCGLPAKNAEFEYPHDTQPNKLTARWGLRRLAHPARTLLPDGAQRTDNAAQNRWDAAAKIWSSSKLATVRQNVAEVTRDLFGWDEDIFNGANECPKLLLEQFEDIYLAAPRIAAPV